jgi:hypothetical protein
MKFTIVVRQSLHQAMWRLGSKFIEFGEYISVEFDTEAQTATVVQLRK